MITTTIILSLCPCPMYSTCNTTSKLKILQIIMWNIGMAQKAEETRLGCLVHILL